MAVYTVYQVTNPGVSIALEGVTASDSFVWPSKAVDHVIVVVNNGSGSSNTVTFSSAVDPVPDGLAQADKAVIVAAGSRSYIRVGRDAFLSSEGSVAVTHSNPTSNSVNVFYAL